MRPKTKLILRAGLVCSVLAWVAAGATAANGPQRSKSTCTAYLAFVASTSSHVALKNKVHAGSWGTLPSELRKLPPGAELCGSVESAGPGGNVVVVRSALFGKDLESFYAPLYAQIGCKPLICRIKETDSKPRTLCYGDGPKKAGSVSTDASDEMYSLNVF
jgi:hypothetical protein